MLSRRHAASAHPPRSFTPARECPAPTSRRRRYEKYDSTVHVREKTDDPFQDEVNLVSDKVQDLQLVRWTREPPSHGTPRLRLRLPPAPTSSRHPFATTLLHHAL